MAKVEIEWNDEGFMEILTCEKLCDYCVEVADEIVETAGKLSEKSSLKDVDGGPVFKVKRVNGSYKLGKKRFKRCGAKISTGNWQARRIEAKHKVLEKAVNKTKP